MKKINTKLLITILIIVVGSLSATYAYLALSVSNNVTAGEGGCFDVNYTGTAINSAALASTDDYTKGANSTITLSKAAGCEIYTEASIYLHTNPISEEEKAPLCPIGTADPDQVAECSMRYKIMQGSTEISGGVITEVTEGNEDQLLAVVPLTNTSTQYKVYIWVDATKSKGVYNLKSYSGHLYATSNQTSTVE